MSASAPFSEKIPRQHVYNVPRLKNPLGRPAAEINSQPKTPRHHQYLHRSREPKNDVRRRALSLNSKAPSNNVPERNNRDGISSSSATAGKRFSTSYANHENESCSVKRDAARTEEFRAERIWSVNHVSEIHNTVADLNTVSSTINKRLDDTYYSILEKLSSLQSTIMGLKELAAMSRQLNVKFVSECHKVAHESNKKLDSFDEFKDQATRIRHLKKRVDVGRQNFMCLLERVRHVQRRVEGWEKLDRQWRNTTRKRVKIFWGCIGGVLALTLFIYLLSWWMTERTDGNSIKFSLDMRIIGSQMNKTMMEDSLKSKLQSKTEALGKMTNSYSPSGSDGNEKPRGLNEL